MKLDSSVKYFSVFVLMIIIFAGCKKDEGPGGTSTIKGKLIVYDFDHSFQQSAPSLIYPAVDKNVYIIYGTDHTTYDDDYKTTYDGTYEFKYLQKGHYRLFAYSKDSTGAYLNLPSLNDIPSFIDVEITKNGSTVTGPDIIILDNNQ
jgi:hypothetical protein